MAKTITTTVGGRPNRVLRAPKSRADVLFVGRFAKSDGVCLHCGCAKGDCDHRARVFRDEQGFCADIIYGDDQVEFGVLAHVQDMIRTCAVIGLAKQVERLKRALARAKKAKH